MRNILACLLIIWFWVAPVAAQFSGGGTTTINNTAANTNRVLCSIRAANLNTTADQSCIIPGSITAWVPTSILMTNCSASLALGIAAGGVYPAASKAGTALVGIGQAYTALTGATIVLPMTLAATIATTRYAVNTVFLSLTTANGSTATCDFYVIGTDLT